jgi:hypothetical protein
MRLALQSIFWRLGRAERNPAHIEPFQCPQSRRSRLVIAPPERAPRGSLYVPTPNDVTPRQAHRGWSCSFRMHLQCASRSTRSRLQYGWLRSYGGCVAKWHNPPTSPPRAVEDLALVINSTPEVHPHTADPDHHLVEMPAIARPRTTPAQPSARSPVRTSAPSSGRFQPGQQSFFATTEAISVIHRHWRGP